MRTIDTYLLQIADQQTLQIPTGGVPLTVIGLDSSLLLYVDLPDRQAPLMSCSIRMFGYNYDLPPGMTYIGTAHVAPFVWHVFKE